LTKFCGAPRYETHRNRPYTDPHKAARRLMQHVHAFEPVQDDRIYIDKLNGPFLFVLRSVVFEQMRDGVGVVAQ